MECEVVGELPTTVNPWFLKGSDEFVIWRKSSMLLVTIPTTWLHLRICGEIYCSLFFL